MHRCDGWVICFAVPVHDRDLLGGRDVVSRSWGAKARVAQTLDIFKDAPVFVSHAESSAHLKSLLSLLIVS